MTQQAGQVSGERPRVEFVPLGSEPSPPASPTPTSNLDGAADASIPTVAGAEIFTTEGGRLTSVDLRVGTDTAEAWPSGADGGKRFFSTDDFGRPPPLAHRLPTEPAASDATRHNVPPLPPLAGRPGSRSINAGGMETARRAAEPTRHIDVAELHDDTNEHTEKGARMHRPWLSLLTVVTLAIVVIGGVAALMYSPSRPRSADGDRPAEKTTSSVAVESVPKVDFSTTTRPSSTTTPQRTTVTTEPTIAWSVYSSPDGSFSAELPGTPTVTNGQVETVNGSARRIDVDAAADGAAIRVTVAAIQPVDTSSAAIDELIRGIGDGTVEASGNVGEISPVTDIDGARSLDIVVSRDANGQALRQRVLWKSGVLHIIAVRGEHSDAAFERVTRTYRPS